MRGTPFLCKKKGFPAPLPKKLHLCRLPLVAAQLCLAAWLFEMSARPLYQAHLAYDAVREPLEIRALLEAPLLPLVV